MIEHHFVGDWQIGNVVVRTHDGTIRRVSANRSFKGQFENDDAVESRPLSRIAICCLDRLAQPDQAIAARAFIVGDAAATIAADYGLHRGSLLRRLEKLRVRLRNCVESSGGDIGIAV